MKSDGAPLVPGVKRMGLFRLLIIALALFGAFTLATALNADAAEAVVTLPPGYTYLEHNGTADVATTTQYGVQVVMVESDEPALVVVRASNGTQDHVVAVLTRESSTAALESEVHTLAAKVTALQAQVDATNASLAMQNTTLAQHTTLLLAGNASLAAATTAAEGARVAAEGVDLGDLSAVAFDVERIEKRQADQAASVQAVEARSSWSFPVLFALAGLALVSPHVPIGGRARGGEPRTRRRERDAEYEAEVAAAKARGDQANNLPLPGMEGYDDRAHVGRPDGPKVDA